MHDAYEPVPILEKLPLQIDCLAAWGKLKRPNIFYLNDNVVKGWKAHQVVIQDVNGGTEAQLVTGVTVAAVNRLGIAVIAWARHEFQHATSRVVVFVLRHAVSDFCSLLDRGLAPCGDKTRTPPTLQNKKGCRWLSAAVCKWLDVSTTPLPAHGRVEHFFISSYQTHPLTLHVHSMSYWHIIEFSSPIGTNRFEVTLEKSNKNFSKKIQQVRCWTSTWVVWERSVTR